MRVHKTGGLMKTWPAIYNTWTLDHWEKLCKKVRPLGFVDIILRSCGQIIFAQHPMTGLCMIVAMAMLSSSSFFFLLAGAAISSLCAFILKEDQFYIRKGIFGFNGAILGIFWSWYFILSFPSAVFFSGMAFLTVIMQSAMMKRISYGRYNLPVMSLPAVIIFLFSLILVYWLVYSAGIINPSSIYITADTISAPLLQVMPQNRPGLIGFIDAYKLHAWGVIFAGIFINSRISFAVGLFFTILGMILITSLPQGRIAMGTGVFLGFNVLPLSIGLLGLFMMIGLRAFLWTVLALPACFGLWMILAQLLSSMNLPFLTLPFNLTVIMTLILAKKMGEAKSGIATVPLDMVTTPEQILKTYITPFSEPPKWENTRQTLKEAVSRLIISRRDVEQFRDLVEGAKRISILSGAGTSTESGIPDFRSNTAYWRQFGAEDFTYQNFLTRPDIQERYWIMDRQFHKLVAAARPNDLHKAIKKLDDEGKIECIVTQNVDGLFQKAGVDPSKVIEVHGTALNGYCLNCGAIYPRQEIEISLAAGIRIPYCPYCFGLLKPMTILMGEDLNQAILQDALARICSSDLLVIIGTSLQVDPVASMPDVAWQNGVPMVIINLNPTTKDHLARLIIRQAGARFLKKVMRDKTRRG